MDRITRKELKTDKFAEEVSHSLEFVAEHRKQAKLYGGIAAAVLIAGLGGYSFFTSRAAERQADLSRALEAKEGVVGAAPQPGDPRRSFLTQADKDKAVTAAFNDVVKKWSGTDEAAMAHFQLGVMAADEGKLDEAGRHFQAAIRDGGRETASVAKLSLAQVYQATNKNGEAEKLYRELIANPTVLVSKEQATWALARMLATSNPAEARKLVQAYEKDDRPAIARAAAVLLQELPAAK